MRSGRRGQGHGDRRSQMLAHLGQPHIFRPEIVSPEAQAVGFVHHEEPRLQLRQDALERRRREPFGRDIEQSRKTSLEFGEYFALLLMVL